MKKNKYKKHSCQPQRLKLAAAATAANCCLQLAASAYHFSLQPLALLTCRRLRLQLVLAAYSGSLQLQLEIAARTGNLVLHTCTRNCCWVPTAGC
jgi:hypothetical protein